MGFSIDVDVALWIDPMKFQGKTPLREACGFVIVDGALNDHFDHFKKDIDPECSTLYYSELLQFWAENQSHCLIPPVLIDKFESSISKYQVGPAVFTRLSVSSSIRNSSEYQMNSWELEC